MSRYLVFKRSLYRSIKSIIKTAKMKAEKVETTQINQRTGYDFFSATYAFVTKNLRGKF